MNFFEQELHKIVAPKYPDATYVGRACYVRLDELNRAKIQFVTSFFCPVGSPCSKLDYAICYRTFSQRSA